MCSKAVLRCFSQKDETSKSPKLSVVLPSPPRFTIRNSKALRKKLVTSRLKAADGDIYNNKTCKIFRFELYLDFCTFSNVNPSKIYENQIITEF